MGLHPAAVPLSWTGSRCERAEGRKLRRVDPGEEPGLNYMQVSKARKGRRGKAVSLMSIRRFHWPSVSCFKPELGACCGSACGELQRCGGACIAEELVHLMSHERARAGLVGQAWLLEVWARSCVLPVYVTVYLMGASRRQVLLGDTRGQGKTCEVRLLCHGRHRRVST